MRCDNSLGMANETSVKTKTILLIEDDTVLAKMYSQKLLSVGYDVVNAGDGEEGYKLATTNKIDLVLTDIMLPRVSGVEFIQKIKANKKYAKIPVIAWSNLPDEAEKALSLGAEEYLIKGKVTLDEIAQVVNKYIT